MRTALCFLVAVLLAPAAPRGQAPPARAAQAAPSLLVSLRGEPAQPGGVVAVAVRAPQGFTSVTASVFDVPVPFSPGPDPGTWDALVGIDVLQPPGTFTLTVRAIRGDGEDATASAALVVQPRQFPTRRLSVAGRFVDPSPDQLARALREADLMTATFGATTPRRWQGPFDPPARTAVNSNFGTRSIFNGQPRAPHAGVDFRGAVGTPVAAPNAGRIVLAQDLFFTGNTVIIDHGSGLFSLLAHLSAIDVSDGQSVERGAVVGRLGATGRVTGPHLHWAVRLNNARVDPMRLIALLAATPAGPGGARAAAANDRARLGPPVR